MTTVTDPRLETKDPRFDSEYSQPAVPPVKRNPWRTCVIGCLVFAALAMLLFVVAAIWVWRNVQDLMAAGATEAMSQMIDTTDLPAEERRDMKAQVERIADAYRDGRITHEQLVRIVQDFVKSPLLAVFVVSAVEKQYFETSGLSAEEKVEGRLALQRFVRGAIDKKIKQDGIDAVLKHIGTKQPDGNWQLNEKVSDADLRAALAEAKRVADDAGIPEQPERVDASDELKRIVDEAMNE